MISDERGWGIWADMQTPRLVTTKQAMGLFGFSSFVGFRKYLLDNSIHEFTISRYPHTLFYNRREVAILAAEYLDANSNTHYEFAPSDGSPSGDISKYQLFSYPPESGWTAQEFLSAWGKDLGLAATTELLELAPTLLRFVPVDAYHLIGILLECDRSDIEHSGFRLHRAMFTRVIADLTDDKLQASNLRRAVLSLYYSTDIGKLNPDYTVRVIYELMVSNTHYVTWHNYYR